jgi:hypothetical protein
MPMQEDIPISVRLWIENVVRCNQCWWDYFIAIENHAEMCKILE